LDEAPAKLVRIAPGVDVNLDPSTVVLVVAVAWVCVVPLVYRMATPIPPGDLAAIERFVANRDEKLNAVRKMWMGGPARSGGRAAYIQVGRPYRVVAQSTDGLYWTHALAVDGVDVLGNPQLKQRLRGVWTPVIQ